MTYRRTKQTKNRNKNIKRMQIRIGDLECYCDENNIGIQQDTYKALNAYVQICKMFDKFYFTNKKKDWEFCELLEVLRDNKKYLQYLYKLNLTSEKDFRSGESYGYNTQEYIEERMSYICDRWNCAFRIKLILDLLDRTEEK